MTPTFTPRFDADQERLTAYSLRLETHQDELLALSRYDRAFRMKALIQEANDEVAQRVAADLAAQQSEHEKEQAALVKAFNDCMDALSQAAVDAHGAHERLEAEVVKSEAVIAKITDPALAEKCRAELNRPGLQAALRARAAAI